MWFVVLDEWLVIFSTSAPTSSDLLDVANRFGWTPTRNGLTGYGWVDCFELLDVNVSYFFSTVDAFILECRLGVLIKFSVDEPLSLSVFAKVDAILLSASLSSC